MFVRMSVFVRVSVDDAIGVPVLMRMNVGMDVRVRMVVLDLTWHRLFLLKWGSEDDR